MEPSRTESTLASESPPATGADDGPLSFVLMGTSEPRRYPLPRDGVVRVGRSEECEISIDEAKVSRVHLVVTVTDGKLAAVDKGSRNGTWIGARRLVAEEATALTVGDVLRIGSTLLLLQHGDVAASYDLSASLPPRSTPEANFDDPMRGVWQLVDRVAPGSINVLLLGETGVGKEVVARELHARSQRRTAPLVCLNCAALSESLLESELFGHEKGAFTSALRDKPGLLESADGGSVFLDELGEMPLALQAKLLRAIENREVQRIGSLRPRSIDVRFIAATNRKLEAEISAGRFRQDLYFRLNGVTVRIPPLRERRGEIEPLAQTFLDRANAAMPSDRRRVLSPAAVVGLLQYDWPGNVRELRNVIERAALLCPNEHILPEHLDLALPSTPTDDAPASDEVATGNEHERVIAALEQCAGNQTHAAKLLGISRGTLIVKLAKYNVPRPRKRR